MTILSHVSKLAKKMPGNTLRVKPLFLAALLVFSFLSSVVISTGTASAVSTSAENSKNPDWQIKSFLYYRAMANCIANGGMADGNGWENGGRLEVDKIETGEWFGKPGRNLSPSVSPIGMYLRGTAAAGSDVDGERNCDAEMKPLVKAALKHWQLDATTTLCNMGMQRMDGGKTLQECIQGTETLERKAGGATGWPDGVKYFRGYINKMVYGINSDTQEPTLLDHEWYLFYKTTLAKACISKISAAPTSTTISAGNQYGYTGVKWVDISQTQLSKMIVTGNYIGEKKKSDDFVTRPGPGTNFSAVRVNCADMVTNMNKYAGAYAKWAFDNKIAAEEAETATADQPLDGTGGTTCAVDGIGWILCPLANAMAGITDGLLDAVSAFMRVEPVGLSTKDNPLYDGWAVMRSFANVAFVIVFLFIIFSQLTSAGVSNYGVKKLLPRLIIGAILVNVSFFICAIAVDVSNILGVGIQDLFNQIAPIAAKTGEDTENWGSITTAILGGSAAIAGTAFVVSSLTAGGIWGVLAGLLPLLVGALFALVVAFLVLLARQALIIMLIVIAPVAFVAFLLPNTEDLFKKWRKLFISLLVLFPLISLVFGGATLASIILRGVSDQMMDNGGNDLVAFFMYIGSFAIQVIPLAITPLLINLSQGVLSRFAGLVNNPNKGPFDRLRKGGERIAKDTQNRQFAKRVNSGKISSYGARRRARIEQVSGSLDGLAKHNSGDFISEELGKPDSRLALRMAGGDKNAAGRIADSAIASAEAEELKSASTTFTRTLANFQTDEEKKAYTAEELSKGGSRAAAVLHHKASIGDESFIRDQITHSDSIATSDPARSAELKRQISQATQTHANMLLGKAPDLVKGASAAFDSVKGADLAGFTAKTAEAYMKHLSTIEDPEKQRVAMERFNSAVVDISRSPELQSRFDGGTGLAIMASIQNMPPNLQNNMTAAAGIQGDGKIR